jgi:hypothetical protein
MENKRLKVSKNEVKNKRQLRSDTKNGNHLVLEYLICVKSY